MTKREYLQLHNLLIKHQEVLEKELRENDYREIYSVEYSKREQIASIKILLVQLRYKAGVE